MISKKIIKLLLTRHSKIVIFFVILLLFISFSILFSQDKKNPPPTKLSGYITTILKDCQDAKFKDQCYKGKVLSLTNAFSLSMQDAFAITDLLQQQSTSYMNCHDLAHELGALETKKDPNRWKDVIVSCPTTMCNNGCSHGVLTERYKAGYLSDEQIEDAKKEFVDICMPRDNWHPSNAGIYNCHHGIGHLSMYITKANIKKSIQLCKDIGKKPNGIDYTETCIGAIFMTIFQPLDTDDTELIAKIAPTKTKSDVEKFCRQFTEIPFNACHRESWTYFWDQIQTPKGLRDFCEYTSDTKEQLKCYSQLMSPLTSNFVLKENNLPKLASFCKLLPSTFQSVCFANAARRILQINASFVDKAVSVCNLAEKNSKEDGKTCYDHIIRYGGWIYNLDKQKNEYRDYCNQFPEIWKDKCLALII